MAAALGSAAMISPDCLCQNLPPLDLRHSVTQQIGPLPPEWQRLAGGRSNQVWRCGTVVIKHYRPQSATPLFPNDPQAESLALQVLAPLGLAPEPLAKGSGWLAWRHLPGQSWQGEGGVSKLLQQLAQVPVFPGLSQRPMGAAAIAQHATSFAPAGLPALPAPVEVALPRPSLLHGDFVPGNILATPGGLRLIDWQCPGLGDPVDDLALFLSPAMQFLYRGRPLASAEIEALMLDLPGDLRARYAVLRPILHWRIAAHCALRAARGDGDYDAALRLELAGL